MTDEILLLISAPLFYDFTQSTVIKWQENTNDSVTIELALKTLICVKSPVSFALRVE